MDRSILFVFAHPDDESHWSSGIALRCHHEGVRTALVTATLGGRGTTGGLCSIDELPGVREQELREAARVLQFDSLEILPYQDKELPNAPPDEIRRALVTIIRRERPSIVVTFDPDGLTMHLDHLAISRFTSDAIAAAADPRWFPASGPGHAVARLLWTAPVMPWDDGDFAPRPGVDFLVDTSAWWRQRAEALSAHRTQRATLDKLYLKQANVEHLLSFDVLRQAWGPPIERRPADDVFAGL
ncbi:MAG: PIG-L family deacetylase [Acidobacteriota bacterium]